MPDHPEPTRKPLGLSKAERLSADRDFEAAFTRGRRVSDKWLILYVLPNDLGWTRIGIRVSRKCGNAVRRSLIKRRLREAFRTSKPRLPAGLDIIAVARAHARPPLYAELVTSLASLVAKAARAQDRPR